eukprot:3558555-Pyramimonas_sp.AAC.1
MTWRLSAAPPLGNVLPPRDCPATVGADAADPAPRPPPFLLARARASPALSLASRTMSRSKFVKYHLAVASS